MSSEYWNPQEEECLANHIAKQVIDRASGRSEQECLFKMPQDSYFIGNLRSAVDKKDEKANSRLERDLLSKLAPVAFGAEFLVCPQTEQLDIEITLQWSCYYRVFPTYKQQHIFSLPSTETDENEPTDSDYTLGSNNDEENEPYQQQNRRDTLCQCFRKIPCKATGNISIWQQIDRIDSSGLKSAIDAEIKRAIKIASTDPNRLKTDKGNPDDRITLSDDILTSEDKYNLFKEQLGNEIPLSWKWSIQVDCQDSDSILNADEQGGFLVSINFTNISEMPERSSNRRSSNREDFLFDTRANFHFLNGDVAPFTLDLAPQGFRYDREIWGRGFNCDVCVVEQNSTDKYYTTHTPCFRQTRYLTKMEPTAPFKTLAEDPIPVLESIHSAMKKSLEDWDTAEADFQQRFTDQWEAEYKQEFDLDKHNFLLEIEQFERGLDMIRTNHDIRLAFCLTNETFRRAGDRPSPKRTWRLFQIVFLVSQIPGIAALANPRSPDELEREMVDIIYFPTGGGKTEAYLGVLVFHCFFDRLRGKQAGVTAWTRFPLRLLTLQQTQRMSDIIGMAELVRRAQEEPRLKNAAGFAVGYFVGKESTPNELVDINISQRITGEARVNWSLATNEQMRQRWKRVVSCPACFTNSVEVDLDEPAVRIRHRCKNENCAFPNGNIPVYVIDNEIYRYLPSVIVGTIDKLASIGNQRKLSILFGKVTGRCTKHGYYNGKCCQQECNDPKCLIHDILDGITGPTLFIQDELHLLREGLGTFDAHYETFTQELLKHFGQTHPLKIIASSATIEAFDRQVEHLYGRLKTQSRVFPSQGPTVGNSFYAETQGYAQRLFFGIIAHNKTVFNATLELLQFYHEVLQDLQKLPKNVPNPYNGRIQPGSEQWEALIDNYMTSLTYFLVGRELSSIRTDLENEVNTDLQQDGYLRLAISEMTGSTSTDEVTRILQKLENPRPHPAEPPDAILATNMISHGVDVDRLNAMFFYGMPRQNAEYIQASSRVGRQHVGIVLMCLHPVRERDQSHYVYFRKYHDFLGQMIEPVAINRWAKFSTQRTLPGLFMAVLLQLLSHRQGERSPGRFYRSEYIRRKLLEGQINEDDFIPFLKAAYGVTTASTPAEITVQNEIESRVRQNLDRIRETTGDNWLSDVLYPRPMMSLRDVDEPIEIELDDRGSRWASEKNRD